MVRKILLLLLFIVTCYASQAQSIKDYEYWMDSNYASRVKVSGSNTSMSIPLDGMAPGVHFFNFRSTNSDGVESNIYRTLIYLPEEVLSPQEVTGYEYWIDEDVDNKVAVNDTENDYAFSIDVSDLADGIHYLHFRIKNTEDLWSDVTSLCFLLGDFESMTPFAGIEVQEGDEFYLYNVDSGLWLQENNRFTADWNTHGELGTVGFDVKLIKLQNGWQIKPKFGHNNSMNSSNLYLDTPDAVTAWTFEPVAFEGVSNAYYIKSGDNYLRAGNNDKLECTNNNSKNIWQIVTRQQRIDYVKTATEADPKDISFLIRGNEFSHEDTRRHANWKLTDNDNGGIGWEAGRFDIDNRQNSVFEAWDMTKMNLSQTIDGLPTGIYELEARASESPTGNGGVTQALLNQYNTGTLEQYGVLYANNVTVRLPSIYSEQYSERTGHYAARNMDGTWMIDGVNQFCYGVANKESAFKVVSPHFEIEGKHSTIYRC